MQEFTNWTLLLSGAYLVFWGMNVSTDNFRSELILKMLPVLLGFACLLSAAYSFGLL